METIKIKYHTDIEPIKKFKHGDWIDLRAAEDVFIPLNESRVISLGVSMKLPDGYEAYLASRSSTFKNFGIQMVNSIGIIDNSYSGTNDIWRFPAICLKPTCDHNGVVGTYISKGDRICQFRIVKQQPEISFETVDTLDDQDRGGIGSTGVR